AYAASRCAGGTARRTSRETDEVNGITMTARIRAAESSPTPSGGPLNSGKARSAPGNDDSSDRTAGTSTKMPHRPYTIDGLAASSSVRNTSGWRRGGGHSSAMNTAMPSAIGVAMSSATTDEYSVPQMNGSAPNRLATGSHVVVHQNANPN